MMMTPEKLPSTPEVFTGELEKSGGFLTQFLVFWQQSKTESSDYAKIPYWEGHWDPTVTF